MILFRSYYFLWKEVPGEDSSILAVLHQYFLETIPFDLGSQMQTYHEGTVIDAIYL